jgi:expansin (peptidoglycan-binding protein)
MRWWLVMLIATGCGSNSATPPDDASNASSDGAIGSCTAAPAGESGDGTYYDADGTGNCSFDASPNDLMVAAMNKPDYGNAVWCGACLAVTGPMGNTITVRVVDSCPGCSHGDLDLSETAFGMLSPLSAGRIAISWHEVPCDVSGPIAYNFQSGASQYYVAIQIRNSRYPIATIASGSDQLAEQSYDYFVAASGLGVGPYDLRVTDERGQVLDDGSIALANGSSENGSGQFATCAGD